MSTIYPDNNSSISLEDDCLEYKKFSQDINNRYQPHFNNCYQQKKGNENNLKTNKLTIESNLTDLLPSNCLLMSKPSLEMIKVFFLFYN